MSMGILFQGSYDSLPYFVHLYNTRFLNCINMNISIVDFAFEKKWYILICSAPVCVVKERDVGWWSATVWMRGMWPMTSVRASSRWISRSVTWDLVLRAGSTAHGQGRSVLKERFSKDVAIQMHNARFPYWKICYECSNTDTFFNKMCYGHHVAILSLNANFKMYAMDVAILTLKAHFTTRCVTILMHNAH